ncbi:MAG: hypothetical protein RMI90_02755 [Thermoguttaceae bacterium]|nr:hypothetical protein [Thermoguttaceae bacterium]
MWGQMATGGKVLILGMVVVLAGDGASRDPLAKAEAGQPLPPEIIQARQHPPDTYTSGAPRKPVSPYVLESWRRRSIREGWMGMVEGRLLPFAPTKEKLLEGLPMDLRMKVKTFPAFRVRFLLDGVEVKEWWLFPPPFAPFFGLDLSYTTIRDENLLKELAGFEKLDVLELRRTEITDAGLEHLAGLKLKNLTIPDQAKTDLGLKHYLAALEEPKELDLRLWKITDAGLAHLAGLKNLQVLDLSFPDYECGPGEVGRAGKLARAGRYRHQYPEDHGCGLPKVEKGSAELQDQDKVRYSQLKGMGLCFSPFPLLQKG